MKFNSIDEAVEISLDEALIEGANEITFTHEDIEYTETVTYEAKATEISGAITKQSKYNEIIVSQLVDFKFRDGTGQFHGLANITTDMNFTVTAYNGVEKLATNKLRLDMPVTGKAHQSTSFYYNKEAKDFNSWNLGEFSKLLSDPTAEITSVEIEYTVADQLYRSKMDVTRSGVYVTE